MRRRILAAILAGALSPVMSLDAQRPVSIGVAGGVSLPEGDLGDGVDTGWHALGTIGLSTLMQPLGLRLDVAYNRFEFGDVDGHQAVSSATLNATYRLPMTKSPMSPYLISGLGAYRTECSLATGCEATTKFGWTIGLGARLFLLGARSFVEARYHRTTRGDSDLSYFPVTFGVLF